MTDLPKNVIRPERFKRREGCQGERPFVVVRTKAATLIEQLHRVKNGLDAGMSPSEIRDFDMHQCEARMQTDAIRHSKLGDPTRTATWLRLLASEIELEGSAAS